MGDDIFEIEGKLDPDKQHLLKDMGIINILCEILHYSFEDGKTDIKKLNQLDLKIIRIFKLSYKFLRIVI